MSSTDPADRRRRRSRARGGDPATFNPAGAVSKAKTDSRPDSCSGMSRSRPSQNNCHGAIEDFTPTFTQTADSEEDDTPAEFDHPTDDPLLARQLPDSSGAHRRLTYSGETKLRPDCLWELTECGENKHIDSLDDVGEMSGIQPKTVLQAVNAWREWYRGYEKGHITYRNKESGETERVKLENSHMPSYENRYYAKLKGLERVVQHYYGENYTTVMLTLSASSLNANGEARAPADHMMEIREGWKTARKQLYKIIDSDWEYGRVWEHHQSGYGHQHIALFIEDGDGLTEDDFRPFMESYVDNTLSAGSDAHDPSGDAVSVREPGEIDNLASYLSEYLGAFDGRSPLKRAPAEQAFRSTLWATQTRRLGFSNGAQQMIKEDLERQQHERRREETATRPSDRGSDFDSWTRTEDIDLEADDDDRANDPDEDTDSGWDLDHIGFVHGPDSRYETDSGGGVEMIRPNAGPDGSDPPKDMGPADFE